MYPFIYDPATARTVAAEIGDAQLAAAHERHVARAVERRRRHERRLAAGARR